MSLRIECRDSAEVRAISRFSALLARKAGRQDQVCHSDYAIHRRADFMAHVRQKLPLGGYRFLGDPAGGARQAHVPEGEGKSARQSEHGVEEAPTARLRVNDREQSASLAIGAERPAGDDRTKLVFTGNHAQFLAQSFGRIGRLRRRAHADVHHCGERDEVERGLFAARRALEQHRFHRAVLD